MEDKDIFALVLSIILGSILVLGIIGNVFCLIIWNSGKRSSKTACVTYFKIIAALDLFNLVTNGPYKLLQHFYIDVDDYSNFLCKLYVFIEPFGFLVPAWMIIVLSFERMLSICFPLRFTLKGARKRAYITFAVLTLLVAGVVSRDLYIRKIKTDVKQTKVTVLLQGNTNTISNDSVLKDNTLLKKIVNLFIEKTKKNKNTTVTNGFNENVTSGLQENVYSGFKENVTSGFKENVTSGFQDNVTSGFQESNTSGFNENVTSGFKENVTSGFNKNVTSGFNDYVYSGFNENVTSGFKESITSGFNENVTSVFKENVTRRFREKMTTADLKENLTTVFTENITSGYKENVSNVDRENTTTELTENMIIAYTGNMSNVFTKNGTGLVTENVTRVFTKNDTGLFTENVTSVFTTNDTDLFTENVTSLFTTNDTDLFTEYVTSLFTTNDTDLFTENVTSVFTKNTSLFIEKVTGRFTKNDTGLFTENFTNALTENVTDVFTKNNTNNVNDASLQETNETNVLQENDVPDVLTETVNHEFFMNRTLKYCDYDNEAYRYIRKIGIAYLFCIIPFILINICNISILIQMCWRRATKQTGQHQHTVSVFTKFCIAVGLLQCLSTIPTAIINADVLELDLNLSENNYTLLSEFASLCAFLNCSLDFVIYTCISGSFKTDLKELRCKCCL